MFSNGRPILRACCHQIVRALPWTLQLNEGGSGVGSAPAVRDYVVGFEPASCFSAVLADAAVSLEYILPHLHSAPLGVLVLLS